MKRKYYVNIANGGITEDSTENNGTFAIHADEGDLNKIKEKLDNMDSASRSSYVKSHIPYYPELNAPDNAEYDDNLKELYGLLHQLGDEHTREHIESIGILDEPGDHLG